MRLTMPKPPPCCSANAATARSDSCSSSGRRSPIRSASQSSSGPLGAARSASASAWPLPRRGNRRTLAPAASASAAVRSREPSSATITSASGNCSRRAPTVRPMRPSSSRAAIRIDRLSATRRRGGRDVGQDAVTCGLLHAVLPRDGPAEQQGEGEPARLRVQVVHAREVLLGEGFDRGCPGPGHLDTDRRHVRRGEPLVEAGEKARRRARLRADAAGDDDPVERHRVVAGALLDQVGGKRLPERAAGLRCELAAESAAQLADLPRGGERRKGRAPLQSPAQGGHLDGKLERAHPERRPGTAVAQGLLDQRADTPVDTAGEYEPDARPREPSAHQRRIRVLDEGLRGALRPRQVGAALRRGVEAALQIGDLLVEQPPFAVLDEALPRDAPRRRRSR